MIRLGQCIVNILSVTGLSETDRGGSIGPVGESQGGGEGVSRAFRRYFASE